MSTADDMRSEAAADRLLEDSWEARTRRLPRRELISELIAAVLFLATAGGLLLLPGATSGFDPAVAGVLVAVYVLLAGIEFPVGAGNVVPTQLVLVPMLVLLPPASVPLLVAAGLLLAKPRTGCADAARSTTCSSRSPTRGTPSARPRSCCSPARRSSISATCRC